MTKLDFSIVIPNYNEYENISRGVLTDVLSFLKKQKFTWEVLISDDGSTDRSLSLIDDYSKKDSRVRSLKNYLPLKP